MKISVVARPEEAHKGLMPKPLVCLTVPKSAQETAPDPALRANRKARPRRARVPSIYDQIVEDIIGADDPSEQVYFIGPEDGPVKIGRSNSVQARHATLQAHSPVPLKILAVVDGGRLVERGYHDWFREHRLHGEWFTLTEQMRAEIKRHAW